MHRSVHLCPAIVQQVNRSTDEDLEATLDLRGLGDFEVSEHVVLTGSPELIYAVASSQVFIPTGSGVRAYAESAELSSAVSLASVSRSR